MRKLITTPLVFAVLQSIGLNAPVALAQSRPAARAAAEAPLTGSAWRLADRAFKAYNRKDYATAESQARQALALRPDVVRLWMLRIYALQNLGRTEQALQVAQQAQEKGHRTAALTEAIKGLQGTPAAAGGDGGSMQSPAWQFSNAAYQDYAAGRYAEAEGHARSALKLQPDNRDIRSLLIYALERQDKIKEAADEAEAALKLSPQDENLQALRDRMCRRLAPEPAMQAWQAYQDSRWADAARLARQAVDYAPDVPGYRYLLIGALLNLGLFAQAQQAASEALAQDGEDALSLVMRGYTFTKLGQTAQARADLSKAVTQDWLSESQMVTVQRIATDALQAKPQRGGSDAPVVFCTSDLQDVVCNLAPAGSSLAGAGPGYEAATEAYAAMARKDYEAAARSATQAVEQAPDKLEYRLLLTRALSMSNQPELAERAFSPVAQIQEVPPDLLLDVAYVAQSLSHNALASRWFSAAIDAHTAGQLKLEPQLHQNVRQAITDLDRVWGANLALGYGSVGVMNPAFAPSLSARKTLQSSQELYWRPPGIGNRNGSTIEVYARMNQALYDGTGGSTGLPTNQGVLGVRWKPLRQQNYVLAVERLLPMGSRSRSDWLLRAAWSDGEGGALRVDKSDWTYWQIYAEAARFIENPQTLGTVDARYGRAYRIDSVDGNLMATPYLGLSVSYDSLLARRGALGGGPGISVRLWTREDTYHAPRSFIELSMQYRFRLAGDDRAKGLFFGLSYSY